VGQACGVTAEAEELITSIQQRIDAVTAKTAGLSEANTPGTLYVVWHDPLKVAGSETLHDVLITTAGGRNIAAGVEGYADYSLEDVIASGVEVIITSVSHGSSVDMTFEYLTSEGRLGSTAARKDSRVYRMDGNLVSRSGPRLVEGLEVFSGLIHPELFP
ncbi:ABC transporter substrate-binding protein, partial [Chloroflexota bacterium]